MTDIIANNNPNNEWGRSIVEVVLKQWDYEKIFTMSVGGNCRGFSILECAAGMVYDHICDTQDDTSITLNKTDGDTLLCEDDEDRGEDWIKRMIASIRIVDYIQPTLNEVRKLNGVAPVSDGDKPYEPLGARS